MKRRWSDNDKQWGPFTYARDTEGKPFGLVIDSGADENPGCHLRLRGFGHTLLVELPPIVRPYREKVIAESWDAATVQRLGRNWYFNEDEREYGFQVSDGGYLQVFFGRQTDNSKTEQRWGYFLPWTQWRFVRHSWYGPTGQHIETLWEASYLELRREQYRWQTEFEKTLAKVRFLIRDSDGEVIEVATQIEEREWRFGTKWCRWLSLFRKPRIVRSLDLRFASEVGRDKGSWKGGLIGHGIDMLPGELHEQALRRYCEQEHRSKNGPYMLEFIGPAPEQK